MTAARQVRKLVLRAQMNGVSAEEQYGIDMAAEARACGHVAVLPGEEAEDWRDRPHARGKIVRAAAGRGMDACEIARRYCIPRDTVHRDLQAWGMA